MLRAPQSAQTSQTPQTPQTPIARPLGYGCGLQAGVVNVAPPLLSATVLDAVLSCSDVQPPGARGDQASQWQIVDLSRADRLGSYASEQGITWDVGDVEQLSREGGFVWRDLLASGASPEALEASARRQLALDPARTGRQVIALLWYLMERGIDKNQGFIEGAFTCDDPDQKLGSFLRGIGYTRISSHLTHDRGDTFGIDRSRRRHWPAVAPPPRALQSLPWARWARTLVHQA